MDTASGLTCADKSGKPRRMAASRIVCLSDVPTPQKVTLELGCIMNSLSQIFETNKRVKFHSLKLGGLCVKYMCISFGKDLKTKGLNYQSARCILVRTLHFEVY